MAQTGYTPILIYSSSTAAQAPAAGNLTNGTLGSELAINITDGKLFYKDNGGSVQVIAWKVTPTTAGGTGLTSYTAGDLLYYATGTTLAKLGIGASTTVLTSSGTAPQWTAQSALSVGEAANLKSNATTGVMQITGPGAGTTRVMTIPNANFTVARTDAGQTFTGSQTFLVPDNGGLSIQQTGANETGFLNFVSSGSVLAGRVKYDHFNNSLQLFANGSEYLRLQSNGNVRVNSNNVEFVTAGKGIDFSANANAPGMTSELLNWYEEGTWTPTDTSGAGLTFTSVDGYYTKIGRQVFAHYYITYPVTANGSNNSIGGLPFTAANTNAARGGSTLTYHEFNAVTSIYGPKNGTGFQLVNGVGNALTNATCSGKTIMGCIVYFT